MAAPDFYAVLGIPKTATAAEIKGAYRRLAHLYHPDKNPGDPTATARFQAVVEAYQTLSEPARRAEYDRQSPLRPRAAAAAGFRADHAARARRQASAAPPHSHLPGRHLNEAASIELAEVLTGTERNVRITRDYPCPMCKGSGATSPDAWMPCGACGGAGRRQSHEGVFSVSRLCAVCYGAGQLIADQCRTCRGRSVVSRESLLRLRIPPGIEAGTVIRYANQGHAGRFNGPRGDLFLTVNVASNGRFTREGGDLWCTVPLTPAQAALGATLPVELLDEVVNVHVKPSTQPNATVRLPGKGMPRQPGQTGDRGDCYVRFEVRVPAALTREQRRLYEELATLDVQTASLPAAWWWRLMGRLPFLRTRE